MAVERGTPEVRLEFAVEGHGMVAPNTPKVSTTP
jgi:hypothetical protein